MPYTTIYMQTPISPSLDYDGNLSGLIGDFAGLYDTQLFNVASSISEDYKGGDWNMMIIDKKIFSEDKYNEGEEGYDQPISEDTFFYLQLNGDRKRLLQTTIEGNWFDEKLNLEEFSILANLILLSNLAIQHQSEKLASLHAHLRGYVSTLPSESRSRLFRAMD